MKLYNQDFKQIMKGYKAVKTVCKSASMTLYGDESVIQAEDVELSYLTKGEAGPPINIDDGTLKLMEKCKDDFEVSTGTVKSGTKSISYSCEESIKELIDYRCFQQIAEISQNELLLCLKGVKFSTNKDEIRPVLQNISWENDKFVAIDGYRITTKNSPVATAMPVLITPTAYNLLDKLLDKKSEQPVKVMLDMDHTDKRSIAFEFGDTTLFTLVGTGDYMNWKNVFTNDYNVKLKVNRKALIEKLEFLQQDKSPVIINVDVEHLFLETKSVTNTLNDSINVETIDTHNADGLTIGFNPKYLIESLKNGEGEEVEMRFMTAITPLIITYTNGQDLILPIKIA